MALEEFVIYITIAFVVGVATGWFMVAVGSGINGVTREEARRINRIIDAIGRYPNAILTLWSNGVLIDSVTIGEERQ